MGGRHGPSVEGNVLQILSSRSAGSRGAQSRRLENRFARGGHARAAGRDVSGIDGPGPGPTPDSRHGPEGRAGGGGIRVGGSRAPMALYPLRAVASGTAPNRGASDHRGPGWEQYREAFRSGFV